MHKTRAFGLGCGGLLLAAGLLYWVVYWAYCWGWWGQGNKILQYVFQCQCPTESEEARYPENIDVLFSACDEPGSVRLSPSGRYWQIALNGKRYFYDYQTGQLRPDFLPGKAYFLTDEYIAQLNSNGSLHFKDYTAYLYNFSGERLLQFNLLQINHDLSLDTTTINALRAASNVYVFQNWAVVLAKDTLQNPTANYVLGAPDNRSLSIEEIEKVLQEYEFDYEIPSPNIASHNGLMQSDHRRGIVLTATGQTIVPNYQPANNPYHLSITADQWVYDDRGTLWYNSSTPYLFPAGPGPIVFQFGPKLTQPILLLKIPLDYLTPQQQKTEEAKEAQEESNKQQAVTTFWVINFVVMALVAGVSVLSFWWQRKRNKRAMVATN